MATTLPPKTQPNAVIPKTENPATATPTATVALGDAPLPGDTKAAPTAKPAAPVATKDSVAREKGPGKLKESPLKDLTTYDLPASEAEGAGEASAIDAHEANVTGVVTDVVKGLFERDGVKWVQERAAFLRQNPEQGVFTGALGDKLAQNLPEIFQKLADASPLRAKIVKRFGESAARVNDGARGMALEMLLERGLSGNLPPMQQLVGQFTQAVTGMPAAQAEQQFAMRMGSAPGGPPAGATYKGGRALLGLDGGGKIDLKRMGKDVGGIAPGVLDASLEYFVSQSSRLVKGDFGKDLAQMMEHLGYLKAEKKDIGRQINDHLGTVFGNQWSRMDAQEKAAAAQHSSKQGKLAGSIIALIIVIIVAIIVTVFTFGVGAPAAVAGSAAAGAALIGGALAASIAVAFACSAAVAIGLAMSVVVAAIIVAIVTFVTTISDIIEAVAMILEDLGHDDMAKELFAAAEAFDKYMDESGLGTALMVINIVASLYMAIILLPLSGATLATSATAVAQGATAAIQVTQQVMNVVSILNAVSALVSGCVSIAGSVIAKDIARLQRTIEALQAQLLEVETEIQELYVAMEKKRTEENDVRDDIEERQEMEARIMESLNKAAESYAAILAETNILS